MRILEENWKLLMSFFPTGWQQMAWQSGAVERLRGFRSPDVLLRVLMLHVARGCSLRETVVHAKLANWTDISDVALLKRLRNSEEWLRWLCIELLRENVPYRLQEATTPGSRVVGGANRGEAGLVVYRIASGKRPIPARRSYHSRDPDCGWHDRQRARQDGEPMEDSVQHQTAAFGL